MLYNKIETVFERDPHTKKLTHVFRSRAVALLANMKWVCYEKIDGTNTRIIWDGYHISFGGRTNNAQIQPNVMEYLTSHFSNPETEQVFEQMFGEKEVTICGEAYGKGIQSGGNYSPEVRFSVFDININGIWLNMDSVHEICYELGLSVVPYVADFTIDEAIAYVKEHHTTMVSGGTAYMEGLVARPEVELQDNCGKRVIVKIKWEDFKE